jgi:ATP/maltotriose-dependent transcriptional regulator MalT
VGLQAEAVYLQGRYDEAEQLSTLSEQASDPADAYSQVVWQGVRAKILARRGQWDEAEQFARAAVDVAEATDFLSLRWYALMNGAEVFHFLGQAGEASSAIRRAVELAEQKGNLVGAQRARDLLERIEQA